MIDVMYDSRTDRRAALAEERIPKLVDMLRRGENGSFPSCRNLAEVLYRELRAIFRSRRPFSWRIPTELPSTTAAEQDEALIRLADFGQLSRRTAYANALVVLGTHPHNQAS